VRYGDVLYVPGGNSLHALDPATGEVHWRFDAGKWVNAPSTIGPPPIVNDVVYVGSLDCRVYGVRTGR
jgi:outer membrane protein assembly factor BamB